MPDGDSLVTYEVSLSVSATIAERFERYMRDKHIPDVLATGCFLGATFERSDDGRYRTRYAAADEAAVDRYLEEHAVSLRADFNAHFPSLSATRVNWVEQQRWGASDAR